MATSEPVNSASAPDETMASATPNAESVSQAPGPETTVTREQADQIISELKSIKQNIFWLLLVAGFFAARSFFFHY